MIGHGLFADVLNGIGNFAPLHEFGHHPAYIGDTAGYGLYGPDILL